MNENNKATRRIRFSVIDFLIILLVLVSLIGIAVRYQIISRLFSGATLVEAQITVVASNISAEEAAVFAKNTVFSANGSTFGTLTQVSSEKATLYLESPLGTLITYQSADHYDVTATFTAQVVRSEDGFLLGGNTYIAAGSQFVLQAENVSVTVLVTYLDVNQV
ncbi:MAG: DUF4330 family protein [Ruminococcaceae bacterium]|nr:DUF4330 family protein [Oscillospiraceae bacterium]